MPLGFTPSVHLQYIMAIFLSRAAMLNEYFRIEINEEGEIHTLPQVLDGYVPGIFVLHLLLLHLHHHPHRPHSSSFFCADMQYLPRFMLQLGGCNWNEEQACFESVAKEIARFYAIRPPDHLLRNEPPGEGQGKEPRIS